jgi:IS30 family transposase
MVGDSTGPALAKITILPKEADFAWITQEKLDQLAEKINRGSKKCLG